MKSTEPRLKDQNEAFSRTGRSFANSAKTINRIFLRSLSQDQRSAPLKLLMSIWAQLKYVASSKFAVCFDRSIIRFQIGSFPLPPRSDGSRVCLHELPCMMYSAVAGHNLVGLKLLVYFTFLTINLLSNKIIKHHTTTRKRTQCAPGRG